MPDGYLNTHFQAVQPEMKDALKLLNKWYKDGVLDPEFITGENTGGYWALSHSFINGRIGYTGHAFWYHWMPPGKPGEYIGPNWSELEKLNPGGAKAIAYGQPPIGPNGKRGTSQNPFFNSSFLGFGKSMQTEPDKMGKILQIHEWLSGTSVENWLTGGMGIKGVMWDYDASGNAVYKEGWDTTKAYAEGAGVLLMSSPVQFQTSQDKYMFDFGKNAGFMQNGIQTVMFQPLPSYPKYLTDLNKLRDETFVAIITGDKPLSAFDDFLKKWNDMGGAQMVKEANDWYATVKK
jgi:putative aldouronate transport system substrate-binding protein